MPLTIYDDNCSAIFLATNLERFKSKHIKIDYHFAREIMKRGALVLKFVPSIGQLADLFTKALGIK